MIGERRYDAVVIGASAGGLTALTALLKDLPAGFPLPVMVVQHRAKDERTLLEEVLQMKCRIRICQVEEKDPIRSGTVYFAPPDYHLLVESDRTFSLTCDEFVNYSRPSIDLLFESAADVYRERLAGIILTGSNKDGAAGIRAIARKGGLTIAQDPTDADFKEMPQAAIRTGAVKHIFDLSRIKDFLLDLPNQ